VQALEVAALQRRTLQDAGCREGPCLRACRDHTQLGRDTGAATVPPVLLWQKRTEIACTWPATLACPYAGHLEYTG